MAEGDGNACCNPELDLRCHCKFAVVSNITVKRQSCNSDKESAMKSEVFACKMFLALC